MSFVNSLSQTQFLLNAINNQNQQLTVLQQIISNGGQKAQNFSGFTPTVGSLDLRVRGQLDRNNAYKDTISTLSTRTAATSNASASSASGKSPTSPWIPATKRASPSGHRIRWQNQNSSA